MSTYVFYHGKCPDGELSATIFKKSYLGVDCKYFPWYHHDKSDLYALFLLLDTDTTLYFLDVSPTPEEIDLYLSNKKIIIIDHHKNAVEKIISILNDNIELTYDPEYKKSGCQLTWEYIYNDKPYPKPLTYIGDMDVWNFENENTEPFNIAYKEYFKFSDKLNPLERLEMMSTILNLNDTFIKLVIKRGHDMIYEYRKIAESYFEDYSELELTDENNNKYNTLDITCDYVKYFKYIIDYAILNYQDYDILRLSRVYDEKVCYSLRVIKDGLTVDSIARNYGGNGHPLAAGYSQTL